MGRAREHWIAEAYDRLGPELRRQALLIVMDPALAEDAVQQAFMRLLKRGRGEDLRSMGAFLRVVVRHEAYGLLKRRGPGTAEEAQGCVLEPVGEGAERGEERKKLEEALRQLVPEQREVIELKVWEGMTFAEIGEVVGVPLNTAASRYRYALAALRALMSETRS
jgi:RNA polymerase sigma-70 factor, ECF subfamily